MASTTIPSNSHHQPKPQLLLLWFFSTIPLVRKGLMGGRFCKYQTHLLIWTCFSTSKSHGNNHRPNTLPATFTRSSLKLLPFFTFSTIKKGEIKIQTKHKYTYRTNTKQKLAFSCNIFRLFALLLTKTCLRSHWHVHDCDHLLDGDAHDMINTFCARFWISRWISPTINKFSCKFCILIKYLT